MKALKYLLFLALILIIGFSIYVAVQPNDFKFERSRVIKAPISVLFDKVNDFKEWPKFSPWIEQDTEASLVYGDTTMGKGATYAWSGEVLGEGKMYTDEVFPKESISQNIVFIKPFESNANIKWRFEPTPEGTKVVWEMSGEQDFKTKLFTSLMGSIESETGPNFDRGLFKLDSLVQAEMRVYNISVIGTTQHSGSFYLYNTTSTKFSDFESTVATMMPKVGAYALTHNVSMAGNPFILYHKWDEENDAVIFSCCIPTSTKIVTDESDILTGSLPEFKAVKTVLKGDYVNLKEAWNATMDFITQNNLERIEEGPMIEVYVIDSTKTENPANWITEIYVAIK